MSGGPGGEEERRRLAMMADLLERLPAAVAYLAGPDHRFEFANEACVRLVGGRDLVGKSVHEALPEVAGQGYFEVLDEVLATGDPREGREAEIWVRQAGDELSRIFVDLLFEPVRDAAGVVVGVLVHAVDVTARVLVRHRSEALAGELTEAEGRYRTLFETMPDGVVYHDGDGVIVAANPTAGRILGVDASDLVGLSPQGEHWQAVREDGSPFPGDEHPAMVALRTGEIVADVVMGVTHGQTGERRWLSVTAVPDARDEQGRPQRAYAMFQDVTEQRRAAAALRERDSLLGRLRDANVLGILLVDDQRVLDANDAFLDMVGYDSDDLAAGRIDWRAITPPEWTARSQEAVDQLRRTGACEPFEKEYLHKSGRRVPVLLGAAVVDREPTRWVTFVADLSERQRAEQERARLLAAAEAARAEAESADERLGLVLHAGSLVAAMRDKEDLLRQVTRLVVPAMADFAIVLLPTPVGLVAAATEHRDAAASEILRTLAGRPVPPETSIAFEVAYRTGRSQLVSDVPDTLARLPGIPPAVVEVVSRLDAESFVAVPLAQAQGVGPLGVLGLFRAHGRAPFAEDDVAVVEELGRRLAVGLTNADTFAREHTVAEMLQQSVLPEVLPDVDGVDLAVVYLPATEDVDVGGDWYDAFPLGQERLGIVLGDVVGHNLASASVMNQVRNALRAYAVDTQDPGRVLARTNKALVQLMPEAMATVLYGVLDVRTGELSYASAGHPPPLLAGPDGSRYLIDGAGMMLGVADSPSYTTARDHLLPGSSLLLFSDGLVEDRSRSLDEGLDALASVFSKGEVATAEEACALAQGVLVEGSARADDVCLLAVRVD